MTVQVIDGTQCDISWNPTRMIFSINVSTTRNIPHMLCEYDLATAFNRRPVRRAATVYASYSAPCLNIIVLLRIHGAVKDGY